MDQAGRHCHAIETVVTNSRDGDASGPASTVDVLEEEEGSVVPGERAGARLVDPLGVALPFALAQHELLHLARGRLRQVAKFDDLGALEVR